MRKNIPDRMGEKYVASLIDALANHPGMPTFNHSVFAEVLSMTPVHQSTRFYADVPSNPGITQRVEVTSEQYTELSLRRVLRLFNLQPGYKLGLAKKLWGDCLSARGIFSSNALTRSLRADPDASKELFGSHHDYAVLAKLRTYSLTGQIETGEITPVSSKPIIIIPGIENMGAVLRWEDRNTVYHH